MANAPTARSSLRSCRLLALALVVVGLLAGPSPVGAGAFVFAGEANGIDVVTHPTGYTGSGGALTVTVCIDPTSANAPDMVIPVRNIIHTWNEHIPVTGNLLLGGSNDIPPGSVDFESVALHELGHCIGAAHPNLASESGLSDPQANSTNSTDGADNAFDVNSGTDGVYGSSDDPRDDDVNLHWFRQSNNNPFTIATTVDSSTYSRDLADLPSGNAFATNGDRDVSSLLGVPDTEAVMQQGTLTDEDQRRLAHDDVATLLYATGGLDETAGNSDDYALNLSYAGLTTSCDVVLDFDDTEAGFADCQAGGSFIGGTDHIQITSADIFFNTGFSWHFNDVPSDGSAVITEIIDTTGDGAGNTLDSPTPAAVDSSGNVYVGGSNSDNVFKITPSGTITEIIDVAGDGGGNPLDGASGISVDSSGNVYVVGRHSDNAFKVATPVTCSTAGAPCTITEIIDPTGDGAGNALNAPEGIAVDSSGNVFVTGTLSDNAFKIAPGGAITKIIDATGDGAGNLLSGSFGIAVDSGGNAYVSGFFSDNTFKITPGGTITEIIDATGDGAGNVPDGPEGIAVDSSGNVYVAAVGSDDNVFKIATPSTCSTGGAPCTITEIIDATGDGAGNTLNFPSATAVDLNGNVYVSGANTHNAFKIATPGTCSTGGTPCTIEQIIDAAGDGAGRTLSGTKGIAVDAGGDVYVAGGSSANAFRISSPPKEVAFEEVETGTASNSASVSTSATLTATANHLYLAAISYRPDSSVTSVAGLGLTWSLVDEQCAGASQTGVSVWQALGTPTGNQAVTATLSSSVSRAVIAVTRYSGVQAASAVAGVVSGNTNGTDGSCSGGSDTSSYSFNVATTSSGSRLYGAVAKRHRSHAPGLGFTERAEAQSGNNIQAAGVAVEDRLTASPSSETINGSFSAIVDWAFVGVEIVVAECSQNADCSDGLFCNGTETCSAGFCVSGTAIDCNDAVACTVDACNETTDQCDNTPNDALCDDTLFCNGVETCHVTNDCQTGTSVDCDDAVSCTIDACNETTDQCDNTSSDALCDDTLFCNGVEICHVTNDCQPGTSVDCDDAVSCTVDACNETTDQCDSTPTNSLCNDGNVCTEDVCHATLDCQNDPVAECTLPVPASTDWTRLALVLLLLGASAGVLEILFGRLDGKEGR